jgi:hypothetical protein
MMFPKKSTQSSSSPIEERMESIKNEVWTQVSMQFGDWKRNKQYFSLFHTWGTSKSPENSGYLSQQTFKRNWTQIPQNFHDLSEYLKTCQTLIQWITHNSIKTFSFIHSPFCIFKFSNFFLEEMYKAWRFHNTFNREGIAIDFYLSKSKFRGNFLWNFPQISTYLHIH